MFGICVCISMELNVPDLLKGRAFAPTIHLYLEGVASCRRYLLSFVKNNEHTELRRFCQCLNCTFCEGVLLPSGPGAGGLLFARELRLSHSYFCS